MRSPSLPLRSLLALGVVLGALGALGVQATVVVLHSLEEMSRTSEVIVHARVAERSVREEGHGVVTLTELEVIDGLKGAKAGDVLTVYQVGGELDGVRKWIEGAHEYAIGEEVVLFAVRHQDRVVSYGVGVGKFRVVYDGAFRRVIEDLGDVVVLEPDAKGEARFVSPTPRHDPSLDAFKERIRRAQNVGSTPAAAKVSKEKVLRPHLKSLRIKEAQ
jgi:hypothetical protein